MKFNSLQIYTLEYKNQSLSSLKKIATFSTEDSPKNIQVNYFTQRAFPDLIYISELDKSLNFMLNPLVNIIFL